MNMYVVQAYNTIPIYVDSNIDKLLQTIHEDVNANDIFEGLNDSGPNSKETAPRVLSSGWCFSLPSTRTRLFLSRTRFSLHTSNSPHNLLQIEILHWGIPHLFATNWTGVVGLWGSRTEQVHIVMLGEAWVRSVHISPVRVLGLVDIIVGMCSHVLC